MRRALWMGVWGVALAGCSGANGRDATSTLVLMADEPPGENCPGGGLAIASGPDRDGNGVLSAGEVTSTRYVCQPPPPTLPHASLVATSDEPPGIHCERGGFRIDQGADLNDDGQLESTEVTQTQYLCHPGSALARVLTAPTDAGCPGLGLVIASGTDLDGDGTLEDSEVETSQTVCFPAIVSVAAGGRHSCALLSDGTVWCWGANDFGQLGDGTLLTRNRPVKVLAIAGATSLTLGEDQSCAGLSDGTTPCWGKSDSGPVATPLHTCQLADGKAECSGLNSSGELGDGTFTDRAFPVPVLWH